MAGVEKLKLGKIRERLLIAVVVVACVIPWLSFISDRVYSAAWGLQLSAATGAFSVRNTVAPVEMTLRSETGDHFKLSLRAWRVRMSSEIHLVSLVIQSTFLRYAQSKEGHTPLWVIANLNYLICKHPEMAFPFLPFAPRSVTTKMKNSDGELDGASERSFQCPSAP